MEIDAFRISQAVATGLMEKWKALHWPEGLWCVDAASYIIATQPRSRKLDFNDVSGAYFLLSCGLSLGIVAFIIELLVSCPKIFFRASRSASAFAPASRPTKAKMWVTMK
jgi:hypothetical protein